MWIEETKGRYSSGIEWRTQYLLRQKIWVQIFMTDKICHLTVLPSVLTYWTGMLYLQFFCQQYSFLFILSENFLPGSLKEEIFAGINFGEYFEHVTGNNFHDFGIPKDFAVINFRGYDLYKVGIRGL